MWRDIVTRHGQQTTAPCSGRDRRELLGCVGCLEKGLSRSMTGLSYLSQNTPHSLCRMLGMTVKEVRTLDVRGDTYLLLVRGKLIE